MAAPTPPTTPTTPRAPAKIRLCQDGCGQVVVGDPGRRFVPGHAKTSARPIDPAEFSPADLQRFWSYVRPIGGRGCWAWTGPTMGGYGNLWFGTRKTGRRKLLAHRVMWALVHGGSLPGIVEVLHKCDVTVDGLGASCVRPDHLMDGGAAGHAMNAQDAAAKGLLNRVLTPIQVLQLRDAHRAGRSANSLAKTLGVHTSTVRRAAAGITWKHLNVDNHPGSRSQWRAVAIQPLSNIQE